MGRAESRELRKAAWAHFRTLPLHVMRHSGFTPYEEVLESMEASVRLKGSQFLLVDHLGYFIDGQSRLSEVQQFDQINKAMSAFARDHQVTVVAIAHPDKSHEREHRRAHLGDCKGSISFKQEATVGLGIERPMISVPDDDSPGNRKWIYETDPSGYPFCRVWVDKWRPRDFGSGVGACAKLYLDPRSMHFAGRVEDLPRLRAA